MPGAIVAPVTVVKSPVREPKVMIVKLVADVGLVSIDETDVERAGERRRAADRRAVVLGADGEAADLDVEAPLAPWV